MTLFKGLSIAFFYLSSAYLLYYNKVMKTDKITKFFNKETKEFHDFVQSADDVRVVILNHKQIIQDLKKKNFVKYLKFSQVGAMVQISLSNEGSVIKVTGQGPDVVTAFFNAKNKLIKALIELQTKALSEEVADSLPPQIQLQKLFH